MLSELPPELPWQTLWAKTDRKSDRWHALPYHLLDVAAAAEALLAVLPVPPLAIDPQLAVFLAAAHDIGKANPFFQAKAPNQRDRLAAIGFGLFDDRERMRHGQATGAFLKPWLASRWGWSSVDAEATALAVGGHHGTFFADCDTKWLRIGNEPWPRISKDLLDELALLLGADPSPAPTILNPFLGWIAGFVSVADWLGSHETMTVWQEAPTDLQQYLSEARERASALLKSLKWSAPQGSPALAIEDLLPLGAKPNGLQELATEVARDFSFAIIEAPTGEGKTEAAFAMTEAFRQTGAGAYFGLPTMATANGLYERVRTYLRNATKREDLDTRLLHSQAWLYEEDAATAADPGEEGDEQETKAQDWFAGSKRGLLTPYGVGTIDQALIASLCAKHGFVRLFALAGKVVVIDEVHAYDIYMSDLLDVLLGWLRALGCKVVMLSATLPSARRAALLEAWSGAQQLPETMYPCITWADALGTVHSRTFTARKSKPLTIKPHQADEEEPWLAGAKEILRRVSSEGGLGALVLNTVADAQHAFAWLAANMGGGEELDLFHARFTSQDRSRIEKQVLDIYGKNGQRKGNRILVATQVVEQSLDLDFDHMVSALAPIDLLLQRAGRLHRHVRNSDGSLRQTAGADARPDPTLYVICPAAPTGRVPVPQDPVYSPDVLLRTLHALKQPRRIAYPADISLIIEEVFSEGGRALVLGNWEDALARLEREAGPKRDKHHREAQKVVIGNVDDPDRLLVESDIVLDEYDERHNSALAARTRLEDRPSVTIAMLQDSATTIHGESASDLHAVNLACVRCSPPVPLWKCLIEIEPKPAWRNKGALSKARPLVLGQGPVNLNQFEVWYDGTKGLQWRKSDADV